ncbi:MAG TPA: CoB--CoM heterodisulfide reductase iron-sulfur subunit A family protein [Deltaproteobacteria bacterium]|nr:CoB--CoM heterodisulfide reductase iron-sulfur subunit A family protein [Deltaproteobacteria bacterium]
MSQNTPKNSILVIGGGVAGISAALDMAAGGRSVELVDRAEYLGGQVLKLDKIYPSDHCAFCPLWTDIKRVWDHSDITIRRASAVKEIVREGEKYRVLVTTVPLLIDDDLCVLCGRCVSKCPVGAIRPFSQHVYPPSYFVDTKTCTMCGVCVEICPAGAIDLHRLAVETVLTVDDVIWATGFTETDVSVPPEFGFGEHPDIMTSLEFEEWTAESGVNEGRIVRKSNGIVPDTIAFIQCVGARDRRMLSYCSAVCCMHALKQAQWVKRRMPAIDCSIFYTDLRTVGRDYYEYSLRDFDGSGVRLIRGRPGLVHPLPSGDAIAVKYENTETQTREIARFDMIVLNGNLRASLVSAMNSGGSIPMLDDDGFVTARERKELQHACGFSREPSDITEAVIQASSAVMKVLKTTSDR